MQSVQTGISADNPISDHLSRIICYPYLAVMHRIGWFGVQNVPRTGPAVIASNHQSYLDPVILSLAVNRRIIFLGWEKFFGYPVLGFLMRHYGTVEVDVDRPGTSSYARLLNALKQGRLCGIFPEGGRTRDGLPDPPKPGVAGLALSTGAPIIPATITGAYRAWPPGQRLPRPSPIKVLFGRPIRISEGRRKHFPTNSAFRLQLALEVMTSIIEGFGELGEPERTRAGLAKLGL